MFLLHWSHRLLRTARLFRTVIQFCGAKIQFRCPIKSSLTGGTDLWGCTSLWLFGSNKWQLNDSYLSSVVYILKKCSSKYRISELFSLLSLLTENKIFGAFVLSGGKVIIFSSVARKERHIFITNILFFVHYVHS